MESFLAILSVGLLLSGAACSQTVRTKQPVVLVAAAADLRRVSVPLAAAFERTTHLRATFSFASSGQLEQQIRRGAPFDVYAPAARSFCQAIEGAGLADGQDKLYALGRLVAWSKTLELRSLDDLKESRVRRIAIANPRYAPYGMAAQQALQAAGLWPALQSKIVYGENVAHTLEMAETGNADVALVAVALLPEGSRGFLPIAQSLYSPIEQAAVVLKNSPNQQAARRFLAFLLTPEAQRIFEEYGFGPPESRP